MKKLLILPGNSVRNQAWGEACAEYFQDQFDEIYLQFYDHWESGEEVIDVPTELDKILDMVENSETTTEEDEWYICAKSVGSLVALLAVHEDIIKPAKCIFFGMPLALAAEELFADNWSPLELFSVPALAFHNVADPVADKDFTEEKLAELGQNITFVELPGDTHDYLDFAEYHEKIMGFLAGK